MQQQNNYLNQACYFANVPILYPKIVASVHLENEDDIFFWDTLLQRTTEGEFNYITHSKSKKGNETSGCEQCLAYKPYLCKNFFICIDSDLRYLLQEPEIDASHFIAQTYYYSWENHLCRAEVLQKRLDEKGDFGFDFNVFLTSLSSVLYKPLLLLLHSTKEGKALLTMQQFRACVPQQCMSNEIENNGEVLIQKISSNFSPYLDKALSFDYKTEEQRYTALGLNSSTAYLFVRGHAIYDLVRYIGTRIYKVEDGSFLKDILQQVSRDEYVEMNKIYNDLRTILNA